VRVLGQVLMDTEVSSQIGAELYERTDEWVAPLREPTPPHRPRPGFRPCPPGVTEGTRERSSSGSSLPGRAERWD
jgi:hypothetical protein